MEIGIHNGRRSGFSLVEVTLSLGVLAVAIVAIYGLLPTGWLSSRTAARETGAVDVMTQVFGDLGSTPQGAGVSPRFGISIGTGGTCYFDDGGERVADPADALYRVAVEFPGAEVAPEPRTGCIVLSWPASQEDPTKIEGQLRAFLAMRHSP